MPKVLNQNKAAIGWLLVIGGGAAWGCCHAFQLTGGEAYAQRAVELGGALIAIGKMPSDKEARLR